jgi:uncharacterized protein involved in exopolysaccharide biosynthesis
MQALSRAHVRHEATDHAPPKRAGAPIDPWWIIATLRRGWMTLAAALFAGLVVGAVLGTFIVPATWESEAVLSPDVETEGNPFAGQDALHEGALLLEDPAVLAAVRERLEIRGTLEALDERVDAEADREANVIRVAARSNSQSGAQGLANAVISTFLEQRRVSEGERLRERARLGHAELVAAENALADARREYDAFRAEQGITDIEEERERAIQEVARLNAEADEAAVSIVTSAARMGALRDAAHRLPRMQTASASRTDGVRSQLAQARTELAAARARYTQQHPAVQALEARIASLQAASRSGDGGGGAITSATVASNPVREELEGGAAIAEADRATAEQQQVGLRRLAAEARERVRALSQIEGQASLLLAAVRVGERQLEEIRTEIAHAESLAGDPPPGYHVAAAAVIPELPLPSRERKLAWALPPLLAFLVAFAFLFWRERGGSRARSAAEVAWWGNAPVIGVTTWPKQPEALDLLVDELEDLGTYAAGRTLVVPATPEDRDLATQFAARLAEAPWLAAGVLEVEDEDEVSQRPAPQPVPLLAKDAKRGPGKFRHRPTLPMVPLVVPPPDGRLALATENEIARANARVSANISALAAQAAAAEAEAEADIARASAPQSRTPSGRIRRASVRLMLEGHDAEAAVADDAARRTLVDPVADIVADGDRPRRITGRFTLGAPTVLVGHDVRVGNVVHVGRDTQPSVVASAAMMTPSPVDEMERRTVHVSGTIDLDGRGGQTPFEVHAEAPRKQDAVLMLAMRILGDVEERPADPRPLETTVLDRKPPSHRALDASESRAAHEQAVALAWNGSLEGPTLRRAARLADRVIVLVREGSLSPAELAEIQTRLGREDAIGFLVVGVDEEQANRKDRVGAVAEFWTARRRLPG